MNSNENLVSFVCIGVNIDIERIISQGFAFIIFPQMRYREEIGVNRLNRLWISLLVQLIEGTIVFFGTTRKLIENFNEVLGFSFNWKNVPELDSLRG